MRRTTSSVEPSVASFITLMDEEKYDEAYSSVSDEFRSAMTSGDFEVMGHVVKKALGKYESKQPVSFKWYTNLNGKKTAFVDYVMKYEKGTVAVSVRFEGIGEGWKITAIHWNSKLVVAAMKCPSCGASQHQFGRYCASCGKPILPEDTQTSPSAAPLAEATQ
jgi:hypothetical protein